MLCPVHTDHFHCCSMSACRDNLHQNDGILFSYDWQEREIERYVALWNFASIELNFIFIGNHINSISLIEFVLIRNGINWDKSN